jgi:hypothetical protein
VFGGTMSLFPIVGAFVSGVSEELLIASAITILVWGGLGFLAGFASHSERPANAAETPVPVGDVSLFRRLLYRFVAGFLLSYITVAVLFVVGAAAFALWHGNLDSGPAHASLKELTLSAIVFSGFVGAGAGAVTGGWTGALLAPGDNVLGPIARNSFAAAALGALAGGILGLLAAVILLLLRSETWRPEHSMIGATVVGPIAGIAAATLRAMVSRSTRSAV